MRGQIGVGAVHPADLDRIPKKSSYFSVKAAARRLTRSGSLTETASPSITTRARPIRCTPR